MKPYTQGTWMIKFTLFIISILVLTGASSAVLAHRTELSAKRIVLKDDGCIIEIKTTEEKTVGDILNRLNVTLGPGDEMNLTPDTALENETTISIARAVKVKVLADEYEKVVYLTEGTVKDALNKAGVTLREKDRINFSPEEPIVPMMDIVVTRIDEEILIEKENVPYRVVTRKNNNMDEGTERVVQEGKMGEVEQKILVAYENGQEVHREMIEQKITSKPVDRIIETGTVKKTQNSRGDVIRYSERKKFVATAYSISLEECGKLDGITSSGKHVTPHHTIAAPPEIPFGTKVYIPQLVDFWKKRGVSISGIFVVEDRGSAIKNNRIDIYIEDKATCKIFGRRSVDVYFIK